MRGFEAEGEAAARHAERWSWERLWPVWEQLLLRAAAAGEPAEAAPALGAPG